MMFSFLMKNTWIIFLRSKSVFGSFILVDRKSEERGIKMESKININMQIKECKPFQNNQPGE